MVSGSPARNWMKNSFINISPSTCLIVIVFIHFAVTPLHLPAWTFCIFLFLFPSSCKCKQDVLESPFRQPSSIWIERFDYAGCVWLVNRIRNMPPNGEWDGKFSLALLTCAMVRVVCGLVSISVLRVEMIQTIAPQSKSRLNRTTFIFCDFMGIRQVEISKSPRNDQSPSTRIGKCPPPYTWELAERTYC